MSGVFYDLMQSILHRSRTYRTFAVKVDNAYS